MKTVMTFGTFDIVHPWHIFFLQQAKNYGDRLITIVARDVNVLKFKWKLPMYQEAKRLQDIKDLGIGDIVVLGHEEDYFEAIQTYMPDIIALGYDQIHLIYELSTFLYTHQYKTEVITIDSFQAEQYKSSLIKKSQGKPPKKATHRHTW